MSRLILSTIAALALVTAAVTPAVAVDGGWRILAEVSNGEIASYGHGGANPIIFKTKAECEAVLSDPDFVKAIRAPFDAGEVAEHGKDTTVEWACKGEDPGLNI